MTQYHIIGGGMAGLGSAVKLISEYNIKGSDISLYEAAPQAGGRCRSYFDDTLECEIDNGNHLLLSGNYCAANYLDVIGAVDELIGPDNAVFPFIDLADQKRWNIEFNLSSIPLWLLNKDKRVPDASLRDHLALIKLIRASNDMTLSDVVDNDNPLYERLLDPLCVSVVNMSPETASAKLLRNVLLETALKGGKACLPRIARSSLAKTFIDPAVNFLKSNGVNVYMSARLKSVSSAKGYVTGLKFAKSEVTVDPQGYVIMALPPAPTTQMVGGLDVPLTYSAIVNLHFKLEQDIDVEWPAPLLGIIGGHAQWVFVRDKIASVTISAGNYLLDKPAADIAQMIWDEISILFAAQSSSLPLYRVIKEKRATLAQTPELEAVRPAADKPEYHNLCLAGDWTDTGLPATIEGAIRSGYKAAETAVKRDMAAPDMTSRTTNRIQASA